MICNAGCWLLVAPPPNLEKTEVIKIGDFHSAIHCRKIKVEISQKCIEVG